MLMALLLSALPARADYEGWAWFEARVPIAEKGSAVPTSLRVNTDARYGLRYPGLGFLFFRTGPIWDLHEHLFIATHLTPGAVQSAEDVFTQEYRLELEPNFRWRNGALSFNDRNRVELRWIDGAPRFRYRNQLRAAWAPPGARWMPYVWDEILVDLAGEWVNQNRAQIGIGYQATDSTRIDVGYMLRSRETPSGWAHDHILNVVLFFQPKG